MKLTNSEKLAKFWNHNINPITGWESTTRLDKALVAKKEKDSQYSIKKRKVLINDI